MLVGDVSKLRGFILLLLIRVSHKNIKTWGEFMKSIILNVVLVAIFLSGHLVAMMKKCPSLDEIKAINITPADMIQVQGQHLNIDINGFPHLDPGQWETREFLSSFDTEFAWKLSIHSINAFSSTEALQKAKAKLSRVNEIKGPYLGQLFYSYCVYENKDLLESVIAYTRR